MKRIKIKHIALLITIITLALTLSTGCALSPTDWFTLGFSCSPPPTAEPAPPTSPPDTSGTSGINPEWAAPPEAGSAQRLTDYTAVVAKVKPSVVAIVTESGEGSGWIIDEDGIIVTNAHVVLGANTITITLNDDRTLPVETWYTDSLTDLAVLEIDAQNLPAADIGDSDNLLVGEQVAAIGNSLGMGISMKGGWISRLDVSIPASGGQTLTDLIETDAAINPGNSGGPLVNMAGEVIGITSVKISVVGVEGMGYAISINSALPTINQLIVNGYVARPYLGVSLSDVNPTIVWWYDLAVDKGAFITFVAPGSPADRAGLQAEDVIVSLDGKEISTADGLIKAIHSSQIGQEVEIVFWRGETENTTYATLDENPPPQQ